MNKKIRSKIEEVKKVFYYSYLALKVVGKNNKGIVISLFVTDILVVIIPLIDTYIYKRIIDLVVDYLQKGTSIFPGIYILLGFRFLTFFLELLVYSLDSFLTKYTYKLSQIEFEYAINKKYSELDVMLFENPEMKNLFNMVNDNAWKANEFVFGIFNTFQSLIQIILSVSAIAFVAPILMILGIIITIPSLFTDMRFSQINWTIWNENTDRKKKYNYISNLLKGKEESKELRLYQTGGKFADEAHEIYTDIAKNDLNVAKKYFIVNTPLSFLSASLFVLMQIILIMKVVAKTISVGDLSYTLMLFGQFNNGISTLTRSFSRQYDDSLYVESVFEFLNLKNKIKHKKNGIVLDSSVPHTIEFKNITFKYPGSKKNVFEDFSLKINPGDKIALVGENGAGKTTLIKLLTRFYDVDKGEILIDTINIKDIDIKSWYKCVGILFQKYIQYEMSAKENIKIGRSDRNEEENMDKIVDSSEKSSAHGFISKYPEKYNQVLGSLYDNAKDPSTGQWQKIALARSYLRDASILVLDEPTAAIDARAEYEIFKKIEELQKDKTVIIISHRFSTVRNAELIYVIDEGKIVESGSHEKLMELNGIYADLFNLQAEGYK